MVIFKAGRPVDFENVSMLATINDFTNVFVDTHTSSSLTVDLVRRFSGDVTKAELTGENLLSPSGRVTGLTFETPQGGFIQSIEGFDKRIDTFYLDLARNGSVEALKGVYNGDDVFTGSNGADRLRSFAGDDTVNSGGGADSLRTDAGNDVINSGGGADTIRAGGGRDLIDASRGRDDINAGGGSDTVLAGGGRDDVNGAGGADVIDGGGGRDRIVGGRGDDDMTGGRGADQFVFARNSGDDTIRDFGVGRDVLDLSSVADSFDDLAIQRVDGALLIEVGAISIALEGVRRAEIDETDFIF